ncbi:MAG: phosphomannomutase [Spirochaetales bacterium]|nr:MAG: phosphomannomutase [Spirochaetales bacterium]
MEPKEILQKAEKYILMEEHPVFLEEVKQLIADNNIKELSERFWRDLDFGTGGMRGLIGGGDNRINTYVIRKATQGLANYIISHVPASERAVAISFDSRHYSDVFAEEAALVLAANDIRVWLTPALRATPFLSYAVRELGCCAGIMVTASHNPAGYNGYKVYWSDGAQVVPPHDKGIITEVRSVSGKVAAMNRTEAEQKNLLKMTDSNLDNAYRSMVSGQSLNSDLIRKQGKNIKVIYTPLHGTGTFHVEGVFKSMGIPLITVPQQREPDGDFPTVKYPNPETAEALQMGLELARREKADLLMATDPDSDRLGIAVPEGDEWVLLTGNQLGALLTDYIFRTLKEKGQLPANPAFINTVVTSEFQNRIAESYGAASFRVLTGFKYIGEKIRQFEADSTYSYVFGGEESYGFLVGTSVRDKDAVSAAAMTAEMALWNLNRGMTVMEHLKELWSKFGYWQELLISREFQGQAGVETMNALMSSLRSAPPADIAGKPVSLMRDYQEGTTLDMSSGKKERDIQLPSSNVLQFVLQDGSIITARPSGTEPKIKFYASCYVDKARELEQARAEVSRYFQDLEVWLNGIMEN